MGPRLLDTIFQVGPKDKRLAATILEYVKAPASETDYSHQKRSIGLQHLAKIESTADEKVKALTAALEDELASGNKGGIGLRTLQIIKALADFGKDAAPVLPLLQKLKLSPNDALRKAVTEAVKKIE